MRGTNCNSGSVYGIYLRAFGSIHAHVYVHIGGTAVFRYGRLFIPALFEEKAGILFFPRPAGRLYVRL